MAAPTQPRVNTKRLVGSALLGVLLASVAWLTLGYLTRLRDERNAREASQTQLRLYRGSLTAHDLERTRYLLGALKSGDQSRMLNALFVSTMINPRNSATALPTLLEYTHDPAPDTRAIAADFAAHCGKGNLGVQQRLEQMAHNDADATVRSKAERSLTAFNAP